MTCQGLPDAVHQEVLERKVLCSRVATLQFMLMFVSSWIPAFVKPEWAGTCCKLVVCAS